MPHSFWCYHAVTEVAIGPLPAEKNGHITFGNLNNFCKLNETTYRLWLPILEAVKDSRLLLLVPDGSARERTKAWFAERGIAPDRLEFSFAGNDRWQLRILREPEPWLRSVLLRVSRGARGCG